MAINNTWVILYSLVEGTIPETLFGFSEESVKRLYQEFQMTGEFFYMDRASNEIKNVCPRIMMIAEIRGVTRNGVNGCDVLVP